MKRFLAAAWIGLTLAATLLHPLSASAASASDDAVHVLLNGRVVTFPDAQPFLDDQEHVQVPVRFVSEQLGWQIAWSEQNNRDVVTMTKDGQSLTLTSGAATADVDGSRVALDSPAQMIDDRLFVPLRFVSESFGLPVTWRDTVNLALIGSKPRSADWHALAAQVLNCKASAYTSSRLDNGEWAGRDYLGGKLHIGTVAVDPKVIPLGSLLYITGYRYDGLPQGGMFAIASDIGSAIQGRRVDLFVPDTERKALTFGFQNVKVYVLGSAPAAQ